MKKTILYQALVIVALLISIFTIKVMALQNNNQTNELNNIIKLESDIYVQHDNNNEDIYLLDSNKGTTLYKIINVTYTASKQWTKDGLYIDDLTGKISATSPSNYISVKENEIYFVRLYGIGDIYKGVNGDEWHITTPIVYFDEDNNCIGSSLTSTYSSSKNGVEITVPAGATKMYISNYNNQNITVQKKLTLTQTEFNEIKENQDKILNYVDTNYDDIKTNPIIYNELDKGYITFVNDDTRPNVDKFADLFISKNIPLCYATVASNLLNNASNLTETRLDVALRVQNAGGELLAHNASVVTENTINDNNFMYNYFVTQKQLLTNMGLNVNGIILAGGVGQITGSPTTAKWTSAIYKYSDLLGEKNSTSLGIDSVYYHARSGLGGYNNDIEQIKSAIDETIKNKTWKVFYFHDTNEISLETLNEILDYINSKNSEDVEVVTYNTMYEKFAVRESTIKNTKKTYYVSSNGTSNDGTDINNPTNLETLNSKKIKTGDTILFKSGDTFFGTLNLSITDISNDYVTISNYGSGTLPTISTYKYISNNWEKYSDNIYRINIKDTNNYTGYKSDNQQAFNVGFLEDDNGNKYYNKKTSISTLTNTYDFYSDGSKYLYMYIDNNPYQILGNLKVIVRSNLMTLSSNMNISNLRFAYTGGHALEGANEYEENIIIKNCIFENIGGSYLYSSNLNKDTRYGNGIEFYGSNAKNITVTNNIFRNIYDVGFTIQGTKGSGTNIYVHDNVFINNSQDSEIWESDKATGIYNYQFYNNLSINQGRGWGYNARNDKYPAASILFWGYELANTNISFKNNTLYNPRQIYYFAIATDKYFLSHDTIKSDNNNFYMATDTTIYRNTWNYNTREEFITKYQVDKNSIYNQIDPDNYITTQASTLSDINKIRLLVLEQKEVIKNIEFNIPDNITIEKGQQVNFNNYNLVINYQDGLTDTIKLNDTMATNIDYQLEKQLVTLSYLGYTKDFCLNIKEDKTNIENSNQSSSNENNNEKNDNNINDKNTNNNNQSNNINNQEINNNVNSNNQSSLNSFSNNNLKENISKNNNSNNSNIKNNSGIKEETDTEKEKETKEEVPVKEIEIKKETPVKDNIKTNNSITYYKNGKYICYFILVLVAIVIIIL